MKALYAFECEDCGAVMDQWHLMGTAPDFIDCLDCMCQGRARRLVAKGNWSAFAGSYRATQR